MAAHTNSHFLFLGFSSLSIPSAVLLLPLTSFLCPLNPCDRTQMVMTVTGLNAGSKFHHSLTMETALSTGQEEKQRQEQNPKSRE